MKKYILFVLFFVSFIIVLQTPTLSLLDEYDVVREYLRGRSRQIRSIEKVRDALDVKYSTLYSFIADNSTTRSGTVIRAFKEKFPDEYSALIATLPAGTGTVLAPVSKKITPQIRLVSPTIMSIPSSVYEMPLIIITPHQGPIPVNTPNLAFHEQQMIFNSALKFIGLHPLFLPNLPIGQFLCKESKNQIVVKNHQGLDAPFSIRLYGPDDAGRFGWITTLTSHPLECFALTIRSGEPRKSYPIEYKVGSGANRSHLLDCLFTPYPYQLSNSNKDPLNFLAENPDLNQKVRKGLTQEMGFLAYRVIYIWDKNHQLLEQSRRLEFYKPRSAWSGFKDEEVTPVPTSSIFLGVKSVPDTIRPWDSVRVFYLPENKLEANPSIYKKYYLEAQKNNAKATYKSDVIPLFKIRNAAHYFQPIIYDVLISADERKTRLLNNFYLALNVYPFRQNRSEIWEILNKSKVPYSQNLRMGLTDDQFRRICDAIFSERRIDSDIVPKYPHWKGFRFPCIKDNTTVWEDATEQLIPAFTTVLNHDDIVRFNRHIGENLLDQIAKSPDSSCRMKLCIAEIYIEQEEFSKAFDFLRLAYQQMEKEGTLSESLWLTEMFIKTIDQFPSLLNGKENDYRVKLYALIEKMRDKSSLEGRLKLKKFSKKMLNRFSSPSDGLDKIERLTPEYSKIIKNKHIFTKYVEEITEIIASMNHLVEFSLQDVVFVTDNCHVTIEWIDDETSIQDWVSTEEYYWQYEKPIEQFLKSLSQKHSNTLQILNFSRLSFGLLLELENTIEYTYEMANILNSLKNFTFPHLKELHLTGFIESSDETALTILENLKNTFPDLEKIHFSLDEKSEAVVLLPDELKRLANIFRNAKK